MLESKKYLGSLDGGRARLTILNIQPMDATNYTCEVETGDSGKLYLSTNILVRRELEVISFPVRLISGYLVVRWSDQANAEERGRGGEQDQPLVRARGQGGTALPQPGRLPRPPAGVVPGSPAQSEDDQVCK